MRSRGSSAVCWATRTTHNPEDSKISIASPILRAQLGRETRSTCQMGAGGAKMQQSESGGGSFPARSFASFRPVMAEQLWRGNQRNQVKRVLFIMIGATALLTLMAGCTTPTTTSTPAQETVLVVPVYRVPKDVAASVNSAYWRSQ